MRPDERLRRSALYAACTVLAAVASYTILRSIATLDPSDYAMSYFMYALDMLVFGIFFFMYGLTIRGYVYLGEKFARPILAQLAYAQMFIITCLYLSTAYTVFQYINRAPKESLDLGNAAIGFFLPLYVLLPIIMSFILFSARRDWSEARYPLLVCGVWLLLMCIGYLSGNAHYIGTFRFFGWIPLSEALFAIASGLVFWKASRA